MKAHTFSKLFKGVAVAASLAALAAPSALARPGSYGPHDPWFNYAVSQGGGNGITIVTDTLAPGGGSARIQSDRSSRSLKPVGCRQMPWTLAQARACTPRHSVTRAVAAKPTSNDGTTLIAGRTIGV